jgi:hypothetical protein
VSLDEDGIVVRALYQLHKAEMREPRARVICQRVYDFLIAGNHQHVCNRFSDGFSEHLYYNAPDESKLSGRIELRKLAPEPTKRVNDLNICRM